MPNILSADQIEFFNREGYLSPVGALSTAEAADCRRKLEDYEASHEEMNKRLKIKAHLAFPWLTALARHPRIVAAVQDIIGPNVLLFASSTFTKNAHDPRFVSWHQDSAYYGLDPHHEVSAWLALSTANSLSGCLRVIPKSHVGPDMVHEETYDPNNLLARGQSLKIDDSNAVEMPLAPGEFSLHHERTIHGSLANRSDDRRVGMAFFYIPTHVRSTMGRRSAMLVAGEDTYGHWDHDPEPQVDLDPTSMAFIDSMWGAYRDETATQSARATG